MVSLLENLRAGLSARWGASRGTVIQDQQAMWVTRQQQHRRQGDRHGTLPPLGPWLDEYEAQLQRIATLSRREGVRLVLVTQPTLWRENMPPELEALTLGGQLPGGEFLSNADRARAMAAYNERLMTFARREGIECIDLASALPQSTAVFYDDCHFNEAGAAKVADYLAPHLQADRIALGVK
ncbi:MAG: hypothetical protein HY000_06900 [Planctomycetes bacterium]|nr:hypothetical protein [Planctomycetota bacterium]